jgi:hypothetical protein
MDKGLLISHAAATWAMFGVILIVQVVHYPLFSSVGADSFSQYEVLHARKITWVVGPLMILELVTAIALVARPPFDGPSSLLWIGLGLLAAIWMSTAFVQVPLHQVLAEGFDETAHRKLLMTNWVRTTAWAARAILAAMLVLEYIRRPATSL